MMKRLKLEFDVLVDEVFEARIIGSARRLYLDREAPRRSAK